MENLTGYQGNSIDLWATQGTHSAKLPHLATSGGLAAPSLGETSCTGVVCGPCDGSADGDESVGIPTRVQKSRPLDFAAETSAVRAAQAAVSLTRRTLLNSNAGALETRTALVLKKGY